MQPNPYHALGECISLLRALKPHVAAAQRRAIDLTIQRAEIAQRTQSDERFLLVKASEAIEDDPSSLTELSARLRAHLIATGREQVAK